MKNKFILILSLSLILASCYYDIESELYPDCEVPATASFEVDVNPIITLRCATPGCHVTGGSGNGDFGGYEGVKAKVDNGSFMQRVITDQNMPPSETLQQCELDILQLWIDQGALNN